MTKVRFRLSNISMRHQLFYFHLLLYPYPYYTPSLSSPTFLPIPLLCRAVSHCPQGYYTKKVIDRADGFVVQTGDADPAGTVHGYVPSGSQEERKIPLEISLKVGTPR